MDKGTIDYLLDKIDDKFKNIKPKFGKLSNEYIRYQMFVKNLIVMILFGFTLLFGFLAYRFGLNFEMLKYDMPNAAGWACIVFGLCGIGTGIPFIIQLIDLIIYSKNPKMYIVDRFI